MNIDRSLTVINRVLNQDLALTDLVISRHWKKHQFLNAVYIAATTIPELLILRGAQEMLLRRCLRDYKLHQQKT